MIEIKKEIEKVIPKEFSGVINVTVNNESIYTNTQGYRDIANKLIINSDTKFGIASGTKLITALGIGKLIDSGELTLETKVWDIFGKSLSYIGKDATIEQLLCHTSGIYDYLDEELMDEDDDFDFDIPLYKLINPSDYLPLFDNKEPKFIPGEKCSYSNGGYVILGAIIEKITDKTFREFITDEILKPCEMNDTGYYFSNDLPENSAIGYKDENGRLVANFFSIPIVGGGDGGIFTTSSDLIKLWSKFTEYNILSESLTKRYITPVSKVGSTDYGLGMYLSGDIDNREIFLYGCDPGVGFHSRYNLRTSRVINILSNRTWGIEEINNFFWENKI